MIREIPPEVISRRRGHVHVGRRQHRVGGIARDVGGYNGEKVDFDLPMVFQVRDNGEGAAAADEASLVFFGTDDLTYCNTQPSTPRPRPTTTAYIQVKPE